MYEETTPKVHPPSILTAYKRKYTCVWQISSFNALFSCPK
jgi:hypothetical protein